MADDPSGALSEKKLSDLLLDNSNPRFGPGAKDADQRDILNQIVRRFGVDDVISSLATNGFFRAEPLVVMQASDRKYVVREGNRRLTACLIISEDPRSSDQVRLRQRYRDVWEEHGRPSIDPVPTIEFAADREAALLSYLGVRHIASSMPWDSYAKAHWTASIVEHSGKSIAEVSRMIGDDHQTMARMVEGYYVVRQLIDNNYFNPSDSQQKGLGSVTEYPFSWVYTLLNNRAARHFLGLDERSTSPDPLPPEKLADAAFAVQAMFGDKSKGRSSLVGDSRNIGMLARALADPKKVARLKEWRSLVEVEEELRPISERLQSGFIDIIWKQETLAAGLAGGEIGPDLAESLISDARKSMRLARSLFDDLNKIANGDE